MAKSYVEYPGDGTTTTYAVTFPYLAKIHVHVLIAGDETDEWEWLTPSSIQLNTATTELITIKRTTPTEPLVDFTDGSVLTENQLDIATIQSLYVAEETQDTVDDKFDTDIEDGGDGISWNAHGKKIINVANGTNPQDAVTKAQLDGAAPGLAAEVEKAEKAADEAEASKDAAKVSQDAAKVSEDNAKASELAAKGHADDAKDSADEAADLLEDTYTKDEVDDLIEGASGAIVANYTNKWASSVARDPGVGNLYLALGMEMSSSYSNVNKIYISDTDGDGEVRNFNKVDVDDQIELTSEKGSGKYTIVSISDVGGYRELVVTKNKGSGSIANDTPVSIVMDVASAGGTGGIEEAPEDGKQYARQDGDWSEVTGGGSTPSPVSFQAYCSTDAQVFTSDTTAQVAFDVFEWDTNSGFDSATSSYTPNVAGYYQVNASVATSEEDVLRATTSIYKNDLQVAYSSNLSQSGVKTNAPINTVVYCNGVDDKLYIKYNPTISGGGTAQIISNSKVTYFNVTLMQGISSGTGTTTATVDTAIGMVAPFAMDSVPTGWLHCDGSEVSRDTYSLLYSKVGDTYGVGDGSTTFNLPDLQDEFIRGSSDTLPVGNKQDDEFKEHTHLGGAGGANGGGSYGSLSGSTKIPTSSEGGEETRPRNVAMLYCINATAESSSGGGSGSGGKAIAFNALLTSAQTIPSSLKTTIFYDDIKLDTDSNYNSATGKYTIQSDGIYRIGASVNLKKDNSLIDALAYLNINSEVVQRNRFDFDASKASSSFMAVNIDYVADLKEGDEVYISAYGRTTDSSDIDLIGGADIGNVFNIIKVSGGSSLGGGSGTPSSFARIVDKKAKTVAGGNSIAGIQVRDLNTIQYDADNIVTLSGNDFTLQAGTYVIDYSAPANKVEAHNVNLFDVTDNQTVNIGTTNYTLDNASNTSYGNYSVTLTEPHTYRVTHITEVAKTNGLGNLNPATDGIFATVDIEKVGTGGSGGATGTPTSFARIVDEKAQDVVPPTSGTGTKDRELNKIEYDTDNIVTLSDDKEFTLQKGTYVIDFSAPAYISLNTNAWLWSVTDNKKVMQGSSEYGNNTSGQASVRSSGRYVVTLTEAHTYKIQQYFLNASGKLGNTCKSGVGIFTTVDIQKVGTGGASSGGGTTDILPVLYSGSISSVGVVNYGTGFTSAKITTGTYKITFDTPLANNEYVVNSLIRTSGDRIVSIIDQTETYFTLTTKTASTLTDCNFAFTVTGIETISVGGGSGGGSGWEETVLFENEAGAINFALSESYDSFDYLRFDTIRTDAGVKKLNRSDMIPVASCSDLVLDNYSSTHMYYSCEDKINFTCTSNTSVAMFRVVGINTGSGSSSGGSASGDSARVKALEARLDKLEKKLK